MPLTRNHSTHPTQQHPSELTITTHSSDTEMTHGCKQDTKACPVCRSPTTNPYNLISRTSKHSHPSSIIVSQRRGCAGALGPTHDLPPPPLITYHPRNHGAMDEGTASHRRTSSSFHIPLSTSDSSSRRDGNHRGRREETRAR